MKNNAEDKELDWEYIEKILSPRDPETGHGGVGKKTKLVSHSHLPVWWQAFVDRFAITELVTYKNR